MGIRKDITILSFRNGSANTVIGFDGSGNPIYKGAFTPATGVANGVVGLVPAPLAGQETYILSNNGWIAPAGGGGGVSGSGVAGRLAFWSGASALGSKNTLNWDDTNEILKVPTLNIARIGFAVGGSADGDMVYSAALSEAYIRINAIGVGLTRNGENILGSGVTLYALQESDRNKYVETTSSSPVTIQLPQSLSDKFGCTIVKGGSGNITLVTTGSPVGSLLATNSVITTLRGAAAVFHSSQSTNLWKAYGNLG